MFAVRKVLALSIVVLAVTTLGARASQVDFTLVGTLGLTSGTDVLDLDGATYVASYRVDKTTVPSVSTNTTNQWVFAEYVPSRTRIRFTDRPNAAADLFINPAGTPAQGRVGFDNTYGTSFINDRFRIQGSLLYEPLIPDVGSPSFPRIDLPTPLINFGSKSFFGGEGTAPVTVFDPGSFPLTVSPLNYRQSAFDTTASYQLIDPALTVSEVPLGTSLTFAMMGLAVLGAARARRQRPA
ncbi:MAG: hypothetical protein V2I65_02245 [Paracoccaceae bacterium]|jgi:hypothetical protein|nr:hypothetical protein [Paracoccaceae bacterium]